MDIWHFIHNRIDATNPVILLCVVSSEGSSPGRQGFKMAATASGELSGSIGGGIMEHKLVTKAKSMLAKNETGIILIHQYHDKEHDEDRSGMICSGSQLIAFIPLTVSEMEMIDSIVQLLDQHQLSNIVISQNGLRLAEQSPAAWQYQDDSVWSYTEPLFNPPVIHIFGAGHTGLAVSEVMNYLGFKVVIYDDRPGLNTLEQNVYANEKHLVDYENLGDPVIHPEDYVVIMTVGYRTDKIVLKQLINRQCSYLGLLGSQHKIDRLFVELKEEGIPASTLSKIFAPVGLDISSQTTREIAVSIAAEVIGKKNKDLPGGRNPKNRELPA